MGDVRAAGGTRFQWGRDSDCPREMVAYRGESHGDASDRCEASKQPGVGGERGPREVEASPARGPSYGDAALGASLATVFRSAGGFGLERYFRARCRAPPGSAEEGRRRRVRSAALPLAPAGPRRVRGYRHRRSWRAVWIRGAGYGLLRRRDLADTSGERGPAPLHRGARARARPGRFSRGGVPVSPARRDAPGNRSVCGAVALHSVRLLALHSIGPRALARGGGLLRRERLGARERAHGGLLQGHGALSPAPLPAEREARRSLAAQSRGRPAAALLRHLVRGRQ